MARTSSTKCGRNLPSVIAEHGFTSVAVEADWPDALRVHRYVQNLSGDPDAETALEDFKRFPQWMWRNTVVVEFVEWLRQWNRGHARAVFETREENLQQ